MVALGTHSTVGFGLVLQGGVGHLARSQGMAVDGVLAAEVVTADGTQQTASQEMNQDLYWALRGCGTNFGVVISAVLQAVPAKPVTFTTSWMAPGIALSEASRHAAKAYFHASASMSREVCADLIFYIDDDGILQLGVFDCAFGECSGNSAPASEQVLATLPASTSAEVRQDVRQLSLLELLEAEPGYLARPGGAVKVDDSGLDFFVQATFVSASA
eukprot:1571188-Amphidinium_carterae.1